jgi:hypothetical protein
MYGTMYRPVAGFCVSDNELTCFIKTGKLLDNLNDCWLLEKQFCSMELIMITPGYENVSLDEVAIEGRNGLCVLEGNLTVQLIPQRNITAGANQNISATEDFRRENGVRYDTARRVNTKMLLFHPVIISSYFKAIICLIIPGYKAFKTP